MNQASFASIAGVSAGVVAALRHRDIVEPFDIQTQVIPHALAGGDVLAQAPTGSGKTLAFGLPLIERAATRRGSKRGIDALILVPTRELAVQVCDELQPLAATHDLRIATAYGGAGLQRQAKMCARADIVVATPGRLMDLLERRSFSLAQVRTLVLDEADRMLDMGFAPQVERITRQLPDHRQTMLFSATLDGAVSKLVKRHTHNPVTVRVAADTTSIELVDHVFEPTTAQTRVDTLVQVLNVPRQQAVVFVRTKRGADRLCRKLKARGIRCTTMHGGMTQSARLRELAAFRTGTCDTMVATDVFARGLDLDTITHVINYDPPEDADTYMHRIGRTGRAGRGGTGISLFAPDQQAQMLDIAAAVGLREHTSCTD